MYAPSVAAVQEVQGLLPVGAVPAVAEMFVPAAGYRPWSGGAASSPTDGVGATVMVVGPLIFVVEFPPRGPVHVLAPVPPTAVTVICSGVVREPPETPPTMIWNGR